MSGKNGRIERVMQFLKSADPEMRKLGIEMISGLSDDETIEVLERLIPVGGTMTQDIVADHIHRIIDFKISKDGVKPTNKKSD